MSELSLPEPSTYAAKMIYVNHGGFLFGTYGSCLIVRESNASRISGFIFGAIFGLGGVVFAGWAFMRPETSSKVFGGLSLLVGLLFIAVVWSSLKKGPWMVTYDRGTGPTDPAAEIRYREKSIPVRDVQYLTATSAGGTGMAQYMVVAKLRSGKVEVIGPTGVSTWPYHWAKLAADWVGVPFEYP